MRPIVVLSILFLTVTFISCKSDKPQSSHGDSLVNSSRRIWIANEGNFQFGNASLGIYHPFEDIYSPQVFKTHNSGISLGDVFQSINIINGKAFLVVNNSGKIEVVDTSNFKVIKTISGLNSPRHILQIDQNKAYVSDLYDNAISILDLDQLTIVGRITCSDWTEQMTMLNNILYVSMPKSEHIYMIDPINDLVLDSIPVAYGSSGMAVDKNENLWVLCGGSASKNKVAGLYKIDPPMKTVIQSIDLDEDKRPTLLNIDKQGENLYFVYDDLYKMSVSSATIPSQPFYPAKGRVFYGLGIDQNRREIYLADARDYVQRGSVYRLDSTARLISSFTANIIPGSFYFE
jgi:DNA-binding beta-propeller fold protein YncE